VTTVRPRSARHPLFYGWIVAGALAVLNSSNMSGAYVFGLCLVPISAQLGLDRAALALAVTLYTFIAALLQPAVGYLADRFGARALGIVGAIVLGLALLLLSVARDLPTIYLTYGALGGLGAAMLSGATSARVVGAWFVRRRGTAMSLAGGSSLLAQLAIVPVATLVLARADWQAAVRVVGAVILVVIVPTAWALIRNTPGEKGLAPDGDPADAPTPARTDVGQSRRTDQSLGEAVRTFTYWQLVLGLVSCGVTMSFPYTHLTAYVNDLGMSDMTASETIGLAGLLSLPGSLAFGLLGDRIGRPRLLATAYALRAITYLLLLQANTPGILLLAGISLGLSWGATTSLTSAIVADVFGQQSVATIIGTMTMLMYLASGTYAYLAGLDYSILGSYTLALTFAASLATLSCLSCLLVRAPRPAPREATPVATTT